MSYAIIRNEKYTKDKINQLCPHNERFKKKYSNQNIDLSKTCQNYHLKKPVENTYVKEFNRLVEKNNLYISRKRPDTIYGCELVITSDKDFFDKIGQEETKRYFKESYKFVSKYQNLGSENIISAVVHLDEETPHMHLVFIPVVNGVTKNGEKCRKVSAKDFWKGKDSYKKLQDNFYKYITEKGFDLERGKEDTGRTHLSDKDMKNLTNFYDTKKLKQNLKVVEKDNFTKEDLNDFYMYEDFTRKNVDNKLVAPLMKSIERLNRQNQDLLIELSKAKNARNYYNNLEKQFHEIQEQNEELSHQLSLKNIELNACYGVIRQELDKNEKLQKILKEKLGIEFNKGKQKAEED